MSFGFSVGDFLAVGTLIADISSCLAESGGSKSDYQELLRELESLQHALVRLDKLQPRGSSSTNIDSIKYTALSCRRPLEHFLGKIKKYDKSLGLWSKEGGLRSAVRKVGWAYGQKDEVRKLQSYLNVHVGTINILLAEHGLEMMNIASEQAETEHANIRGRLDDTRTILGWIKDNVSAQAIAVKVANSMLCRLFDMISGEIRTTLNSLEEMVARVCVSTQQIYGVAIEMKSSLDLGDAQWTFFQAPLLIEDALGRKFPVPSEYDYGLLESVIKYKFSDGPGSMDVKVGNYELFKTNDNKQVLSSSTSLLPGTKITMAILISKLELSDSICPMPLCRSGRSIAVPGGGRQCCECLIWFDKSDKKRRSLEDLLDIIEQPQSGLDRGKRKLGEDADDVTSLKRLKVSAKEYGIDAFRNVRCTTKSVAREDEMEVSESQTIPEGTENPPNVPNSYPHNTRPQLNDGLSFLDQIKFEFAEDPATYNQFMKVMKAFRVEELDIVNVLEHVLNLLDGKEALLEEYRKFLPQNYQNFPLSAGKFPLINWTRHGLVSKDSSEPHTKKIVYYSKSLLFHNRIKYRFKANPTVCDRYLDIINAIDQGELSTKEAQEQVATLFEMQSDLVEDFSMLWPKT